MKQTAENWEKHLNMNKIIENSFMFAISVVLITVVNYYYKI